MMKTKKAKSIFSALFAVVMALCLVVGLNLVKTDAKAADETPAATTAWQFSDPARPLTEVAPGSGIMYGAYAGGAIINNANILEAPNRTVTFQFMLSNEGRWTGLVLLNGKDGWQGTNHTGGNAAGDRFPHIIVDGGSRQFFPANSGRALEGINGMTIIYDQLHTVEIHIGTGTDGDISYMKVDGSMLGHEANAAASLWDFVTVDSFPNGCYFVIGTGDVASCRMLMGEYNTPYVEYSSVSAALNGTIDLSTGSLPAELSFTVRNLTGEVKLTANGNDITDENAYAIEAVDGDENAKKIIIKPAFWNTYVAQIAKTTALTVVAENGKASVITTVQKAAPPVWKGASHVEVTELNDISYTFDYTGAATQDSIVVKTGMREADSAPLTAGEDYTLTQNGKTYTFTLKKEFIETKIGDYRSLKFNIGIGEDSLEGSLYCKVATEGWVARANDLVKGTEIVTEGHYISANLRAFSATTLSSRIYYNKGFDVTKPISLEVEAFGDGTEWALLGVMDSYKYMDYFSDGTAKDIALTALFFGNGRKDIQKLGGFVPTASTNANYEHLPKIKNLVIEMYFGKDAAEEGYFKVNGQNIATPAALQKDFANGKAYVGFFFNHQITNFGFKANKDMNGVGVTGPVGASDEAIYTVDIANPANDLVLDVINTDGTNLKVSSDSGVVAAAEDIAYEGGKLTIKKSFFKKLPFAKQGQLIIEDKANGTGTAINMTYVSSAMEKAHIAFATKGELTDVKFNLGLASVESVMKGDEDIANTEWSYTDGTLTIKKANIADEVGSTEFIAVSGGKLYPLYVYVARFNDGYAKTGDGTVETGNGAYMLTSDNYVTLMKSYDFNAGVNFKVDFKSTVGYYKNGREWQTNGYVRFDFFDPYSRYTFTYILFTNYAPEEITANTTALYELYYVKDAKGNIIVMENSRTINVSKSENPNALGVHNISFAVDNSNLTITVDTARKTTISESLGTFNLEASVLTVETPASSSSAEMKVGLKEYGEGEELNFKAIELTETPEPGESEKPSESDKTSESKKPSESDKTSEEKPNESKKGGCGSSVAVGSVMLIPALAAALFFVKKKEEK